MKTQKLQLPPIACKMCGRVIKHPVIGQKVCNYKSKKRQTKCQIKQNILRAKEQYEQVREWRKRRGGRVLPKSVVCDQCGYEIKHPEYAPSSPTKLQMRCTVKNGRPGQRITGRYSGCQVEYHNHRNDKRNKQAGPVLDLVQGDYEKPEGSGKLRNYPENRKPATARGNYKTPDSEGPLKIGRPHGSATQKGIRGKYSNNGVRKLRTCLGVLCNGEKSFMSAGIYNRVCERCAASDENYEFRMVRRAGA